MARWHTTEFDFFPEQAFLPRPGGGMTLEGGKGGSSAPAPDPRLVEAQIKSMGIQDGAIQQILANSNEMQPLQKEQTQFALDTSRKAWDQSQDDRAYALGQRAKLTAIQNGIVDASNNFNTEAKREELAGQAGAEVSTAFENAQRTNAAQMARMGINPADGKYGSTNNALIAQAGIFGAQAKNSARTAARQEGYALQDRAANVLQGYPGMGLQTTSQGAGFGSAAQMIANQGLAGINSGFAQAGSAAGAMGSNATNMWGQQASYKSQQDQIAANSNPLKTVLGAASGIGTAWGLSQFKFDK